MLCALNAWMYSLMLRPRRMVSISLYVMQQASLLLKSRSPSSNVRFLFEFSPLKPEVFLCLLCLPIRPGSGRPSWASSGSPRTPTRAWPRDRDPDRRRNRAPSTADCPDRRSGLRDPKGTPPICKILLWPRTWVMSSFDSGFDSHRSAIMLLYVRNIHSKKILV